MIRLLTVLLVLLAAVRPADGQVLIRVGEPAQATYSEIHEALRVGTPAADSALAVLREQRPAVLWNRVRAALRGDVAWNDAPLALTRLAELRDPAYAASAARLGRAIAAGEVDAPPGRTRRICWHHSVRWSWSGAGQREEIRRCCGRS